MPRNRKKTLAYEAIAVLGDLAEVFEVRRQQLAAEVGLSDLQWRVLERIGQEDFMPSLFARSRSQSPASVSRTLRQLLDRDLVRVSIGRGDARQRQYAPTARGKRVLAEMRKRREEAIEAVWLELSEADLASFATIGSALAVRLRSYAGRP